jgi:LacI family transcriptional regulator
MPTSPEAPPMRSTPTVYEVAERAGVSTATVSRVLSGRNPVLSPTRERVLTAIAELGYVPSGAAKDLAARRTGVLGLCFPDLVGDQDIQGDATYWYDEVIRGMERAARRSGYAVMIAASHESDDVDLVLGVAGRCDGLVVLARTVPVTMLGHIATRIPVVLLAARPESGTVEQALDHLSVANETGAYEATAHLADVHSYRDISFVAGPPDSPDSSRRFDGFRRAMRERGLPVPPAPRLEGDFTTAGGRRVAKEILAQQAMPRALVCANDQTAIGVMKMLQNTGLRVPDDVAITGFDGIQLGEHLSPSLTTVVQPMSELGMTAVALLEQRMADLSAPSRAVELPVRLERRASCGCPEPGQKA